MLNRHENLLVHASDLLKVGDCLVDIPRREVTSGDRSQRITLKSLQVLLVLVRHQGRVVSREALIEWVWPDTLPTDDVLTQAIAQLRKALGDDRDAPRYVETIAKGGYRLVAPIEWIGTDPPGGAAEASPPPVPADNALVTASVRWPVLATVGVVVLAGIAGTSWWSLHRDAQPAKAQASAATIAPASMPAVERITSLPGSEAFPAVSPDGSQVIYSVFSAGGERAELRVQTLAPVAGRALVTGSPGDVVDSMPAWSPDGRQVAFVRSGPGDACSIQLVPATGGAPRTIAACDGGWNVGANWSPDGRRLVTTHNGALHLIDMATGETSPLPYRKRPEDVDSVPVFSPDGRWIAFKRNISAADAWRVPATGGQPEQLTHLRTNLFGLAWGPGGRSLVFGRYVDSTIALAQYTLATGEVHTIGPEGSVFPSTAASVPVAAFMISDARSKIFSVPLPANGRPDATALTAEFESAGDELLPTISPDGRQVAFFSDRSGLTSLWIGSVERPESLRVVPGILPVPRHGPAWSRDSRSLLVVGRSSNPPAGSPPGAGIYEVSVGSDSVRRLPASSGEPIYAAYGPGDTLLMIDDRGGGALELSLNDRSVQPWRRLAGIRDVSYVLPDPARHRFLFTRPAEKGLWSTDEHLRGLTRISDRLEPDGARRILVDDTGVRVLASTPACGMLLQRLPSAASADVCLHRKPAMITGVSRDAVHRRLYLSLQLEDRSDIAWMRLAR